MCSMAMLQTPSSRDLFDYASVIAPILLSIIAICISIYSLIMQNKIAIFHLRYNALHSLALIMSYSNLIKRSNNDLNLLQLGFNANFSTYIDFNDRASALQLTTTTVRKLEKEIIAIEYIFPKQNMNHINEIISCFIEYIESLSLGMVNVAAGQKFIEVCDKHATTISQKLDKKTYLCRH